MSDTQNHIVIMLPKDLVYADKRIDISISFDEEGEPTVHRKSPREPPSRVPIERIDREKSNRIRDNEHEYQRHNVGEAYLPVNTAGSPHPRPTDHPASTLQEDTLTANTIATLDTSISLDPKRPKLRSFDFSPTEMDQICSAIQEGQAPSRVHHQFSRMLYATFKTRYYRIKSDMDKLKVLGE